MKNPYSISILFILITIGILSCQDFVEIDPPRTDLVRSTVFEDDATANAAMVNIYYEMWADGFACGGPSSITSFASFSADEPINHSGASSQQFNDNELDEENSDVLRLWSQMYKTIYNANAVIEGVNASTGVSTTLKSQLEGEARFIRAFCHFYLVNLYGDVPLVLTTDYITNAEKPKTPTAEVYSQIILDLKDAQSRLQENYSISAGLRVRANSGAATALLARIYLYLEDWENAEIEATKIIGNTALYDLEPDLELVFRTSSKEAILQLWSESEYPKDRGTFFVSSFGPFNAALRPEFVSSFDAADQRWLAWGQTRTVDGVTYFGILKYFDFSVPPLDYSTIMRVAEQYLIRAEARAKQEKLLGVNSAESDINVIRSRAGLPNITAITEEDILLAIENERKWELFGEWGHRWLDLKRTDRASEVLAPIKGANWDDTDVLYPIPLYQIQNDPAMRDAQNPGY